MGQYHRGSFIVLEGGDYTGKKIQSIKLAEHILSLSEDNDVLITHEPTWRAKEIKRKLREDESAYSDPERMAELYIDDRRVHSGTIIEPNLEEDVTVIGNRYAMSTCVYQSLQGVSLSRLIEMHQHPEILRPNLTILLDITPETADRRAELRQEAAESKFENNRDFRNRVYSEYRRLACDVEFLNTFGPTILVDGNPGVDEVALSVKSAFDLVY